MRVLSGFSFVIALTGLAAAGCASSGATPRPFPTPRIAPATPTASGPSAPHPAPPSPGGSTVTAPMKADPRAPGGSPIAYSVTGLALQLRGTPYRNGGTDPSGFDCSGFVQYVLAQHGVNVPRRVLEQYRVGQDVPPAQLQAGDLVFFTTVAPGASHVGIALGGDEFVHAPSSTGEVRVERLSAPYWAMRFVGAKRVL